MPLDHSIYPGNILKDLDKGSDSYSTRTVFDIVRSCLATTFACVWVSTHPNVPFFGEGEREILGRKIYLMTMSLLAPELMFMWAMKQWLGARYIQKTITDRYPTLSSFWTSTHSHFLQMGGFKLCCTLEEKNRYIPKLGYLSSHCFNQIVWSADPSISEYALHPPFGLVADLKYRQSRDGSGENKHVSLDDSAAQNLELHSIDAESSQLASSHGCIRQSSETRNTSIVESGLAHNNSVRKDQENRDSKHCLRCQKGDESCTGRIWEGTITLPVFLCLLQDRVMHFPTITSDEINDRSKSDFLSKCIASTQISWFIVQIIVRLHEKLAITHLEVTTAALAVVNVFLYLFWLSKPFDVHFPIVLYSKGVQKILTETLEHDEYRKCSKLEEKSWSHQFLTATRVVLSSIWRIIKLDFEWVLHTYREAHYVRANAISSISTSQLWPRSVNISSKIGQSDKEVSEYSSTYDLSELRTSSTATLLEAERVTDDQEPETALSVQNSLISFKESFAMAAWARVLYALSIFFMVVCICVRFPIKLVLRLTVALGETPLHCIRLPNRWDIDQNQSIPPRQPSDGLSQDKLHKPQDRRTLLGTIFYHEYRNNSDSFFVPDFVSGSAGLAFSIPHVLARKLLFPSYTEKLLWSIPSFILLTISISYSSAFFFNIMIRGLFRTSKRLIGWTCAGSIASTLYRMESWMAETQWLLPKPNDVDPRHRIGKVIQYTFLTFYGLARICILITALALLHHLPDTAFIDITWSNVWPHI